MVYKPTRQRYNVRTGDKARIVNMENIESRFISKKFIHEKLFDSPKRVEILKNILDENIVKSILSSNSDLLKCNCGFILSKSQEQHLFRKYNYLKYRIFKISKDKKTSRVKKNIEIEKRFKEIFEIREILIKCNLRLIVKSVVRHFSIGTYNYEEFFANGYIHMIRAIDCFDYTRNFKFSTYFINVLFRNLLKDKLLLEKHSNLELLMDDGVICERSLFDEQNERYNKSLISEMLSSLEKKNKIKSKKYKLRAEILKKYYGVGGEKKTTAKEIGLVFGLSKSRVQQISRDAIEELQSLKFTYDPVA